jgi:hypothetical protein
MRALELVGRLSSFGYSFEVSSPASALPHIRITREQREQGGSQSHPTGALDGPGGTILMGSASLSCCWPCAVPLLSLQLSTLSSTHRS